MYQPRSSGRCSAAGERVIRVPPALTGDSRKATRTAGKSDPIDARAVALAAIRDGIESFPVAFLDEQAHEIRVLCDYRDQLMHERTRMINRLRWHLVGSRREIEAQLGPAGIERHHASARAWPASSGSCRQPAAAGSPRRC